MNRKQMLDDVVRRSENARKLLVVTLDRDMEAVTTSAGTRMSFEGTEAGRGRHQVSIDLPPCYDSGVADHIVKHSMARQGQLVTFAGKWAKDGDAWFFDAQAVSQGKVGLEEFGAQFDLTMDVIESDRSSEPSSDIAAGAAPARQKADWSKAELIAMIPHLMRAESDYEAYTGIGARVTPQDVLEDQTNVARVLEARGFTLRSGGADGSDDAFERGIADRRMKEIFLPWEGFNRRKDGIVLDRGLMSRAMEIAQHFHPGWENCSPAAKKMHTRNTPQVLGRNLNQPSRFVLAWTKDGQASGGTGQALRVAKGHGVPVLNMHDRDIRQAILRELGVDARGRDQSRELSAEPSAPKRLSAPSVIAEFDLTVNPTTTYRTNEVAGFCKVRDPFGEYSNMHNGFPFEVNGVRWKSSESLYQAARFPHLPDFQEEIRQATNAFMAKQKAYERISESREDWGEVKHQMMAYAITRKLAAPGFSEALALSGGKPIVEISARDKHWGASPQGDRLVGQNMLGTMLGQLRDGARMDELPPRTLILGQSVDPEQQRIAEGRGAGLSQMQEASGNIVDSSADLLVNTVNCQLSPSGKGVMGKGVALAFKERFPSIMQDYEKAIRSGELRPGKALIFDLPDGRKWCALGTKDAWQDKSKIEWVDAGLKELGEKARALGIKSIALPPPGCGNGGLALKNVQPLISKHLEGLKLELFLKGPAPAGRSASSVSRQTEFAQTPAGRANNARVQQAMAASAQARR